jgi:hypothetical protein
MRCEKFYKSFMIEFLFTFSDDFSYTQNEQLTWQCDFLSYWKCWKTFLFCIYLVLRKWWNIELLLKDVPSRALQNLYRLNLRAHRTSSRSIFYIMGSDTVTYKLFILSIRKTIITDKMECNHIAFVELFKAHLLKINSRFYHLPKPRYMRIKKMFLFFLTDFLYFKLYLMFNVNILNDAARFWFSLHIYPWKK